MPLDLVQVASMTRCRGNLTVVIHADARNNIGGSGGLAFPLHSGVSLLSRSRYMADWRALSRRQASER
ncbi:hypothetical protein TRAPUB_4555 [Trametes pubescens]|uniref:Uncharacterized protein n=1 Tax=Trametes pubescens TaxID=154538 RepID=A0A1M2VAU8_TRAPU|nr:hypothetical protein TRAPUB_4555 [Trametes pubescens]